MMTFPMARKPGEAVIDAILLERCDQRKVNGDGSISLQGAGNRELQTYSRKVGCLCCVL